MYLNISQLVIFPIVKNLIKLQLECLPFNTNPRTKLVLEQSSLKSSFRLIILSFLKPDFLPHLSIIHSKPEPHKFSLQSSLQLYSSTLYHLNYVFIITLSSLSWAAFPRDFFSSLYGFLSDSERKTKITQLSSRTQNIRV